MANTTMPDWNESLSKSMLLHPIYRIHHKRDGLTQTECLAKTAAAKFYAKSIAQATAETKNIYTYTPFCSLLYVHCYYGRRLGFAWRAYSNSLLLLMDDFWLPFAFDTHIQHQYNDVNTYIQTAANTYRPFATIASACVNDSNSYTNTNRVC